jgi:hypothetical protein
MVALKIRPELRKMGRQLLRLVAKQKISNFMKRMIESNYAPESVITFQEQHALEFFEKGKALFMRNWSMHGISSALLPSERRLELRPSCIGLGRNPQGPWADGARASGVG